MVGGTRSIIALLAYHDPAAMHDFLVDAFQLGAGTVDRDGEGRAVHAEVHASDGSVLYLHRHAPEAGLVSPREAAASTGGVMVLVDDVDAHHRHAQQRGVRIEYPPTDQDYGFREYGARDPEGGRWYFAKPI
jgi:uncharacterized glyoxalase superfamily protein PhnB